MSVETDQSDYNDATTRHYCDCHFCHSGPQENKL
jgi:hypothetical protein